MTYTVAQRRSIVEGLVADLENARYTDRTVRYRSGLSALPPPPPPPQWRVAEVATAQAEELVPEAKPQPSEEEPAAAPEVTSQADNGGDSLDDFVTELAEESQALAVDGDSADPALNQADAEESPQAQDLSQGAWREPPTIVGWWEQWFGGDSGDEPAEDGAGEVGPSSAPGADVGPVTERIQDTEVVRAAAMVVPVGGKAPEGDVGDRSPSASHGSGALDGAMTVLAADEAVGTPARLMPDASWPTSPAPLPSPRKPFIVVVQPIPEPSVPIDVEDGLLAIPTTPDVDVEASAPLERDGAQVLLVRAGR